MNSMLIISYATWLIVAFCILVAIGWLAVQVRDYINQVKRDRRIAKWHRRDIERMQDEAGL